MRSRKRRWLLAVAVLCVLELVAMVAFAQPRGALVRTLLAIYFKTKGLQLADGDIALDGSHLRASHLVVLDQDGLPTISAASVLAQYRWHGLHVDVERVDVEQPRLVIRRAEDGSFPLAGLSGGGASGGGGGVQNGGALHMLVRLHEGTLDFENRYAPARSGRALTLRHVDATVRLDQGAISTGHLQAQLVTHAANASLIGSFEENDATRLAQLHLSSRHAPIGPLLNYFVSSPAFVVEDGLASLDVRGYAIGWPVNGSPVWSLNARGMFYDARVRVLPLIVPVRGVSGPFTLADGTLGLPRFTGLAAGLPIVGHGAISMQPSIWLDLKVGTQGPLQSARNLLAFLKPLALRGPVALALHIVGQPANPHIGVAFAMPQGWFLAQTPIGRTTGMVVYNAGHLTLPFVTAYYEGLTVHLGGDLDVGSQGPPTGELIATARGPTRGIPWIANIDRRGMLRMRATFVGPLAQLSGSGFVQVHGQRTIVRAIFSGEPTIFRLGPLLAQDVHGGALMLRADLGRVAPRLVNGALIADHFHIDLNGQRTSLPGIFNHPYGTPKFSGVITGTAAANGMNDQTLGAARLALSDAEIEDRALGQLSLSTQATVTLSPSTQALAAIQLQRSVRTQAAPTQALAAVVGLRGNRLSVYAANARAAGGAVSLSGDMRVGRALPQNMILAANKVQLGELGVSAFGSGGQVTALGALEGSSRPHGTLAAVGNGLRVAGSAIGGDADLQYNAGTIASRNSRLLIGGSAVAVTGAVHGISPALTISNPSLDLHAAIHDGDVGQLASLAGGVGRDLTGIVDGDLRVGGSLTKPLVAGNVSSDAGTYRGVTYQNMRATIAATGNDIAVSDAQASIGSSRIMASARLASGQASATLATPHSDLSDFNDFFGGKDVLQGQAEGRLGLRIAGPDSAGSGALAVHDFAVLDVPIGAVSATIHSPRSGTLDLAVRQQGPIGTSSLAAQGDFAVSTAVRSFVPNSFSASVDLRGIDISQLGPVLPKAADSVQGRLDAQVRATRVGGKLRGQASIALAHGFIGKRPVNDLHARLAADDVGVSVADAHANTAGLDIAIRGKYGWNRSVAGSAQISATDMADVERIAKLPAYVSGPARLTVDASGALPKPIVNARFDSERGEVEGVRYARASLAAHYAMDAVTIRKGTLTIPNGRGTIDLVGRLPLFAGPHAPSARTSSPLALSLDANGIDLAALDPLLQKRGSLEGRLNLRATAGGSLVHPVLGGTAQIRGAVVRSQYETVPLTRLNADLSWQNNVFAVQHLHGTLGRGTLDAQGTARLQGPAGGSLTNITYDVQAALRKANVTVPNLFSGVVDADAGLHTGGTHPALTTNIIVADSDIPFSGILALASGSNLSEPPQAAVIPGVPPYHPGHRIVYGGTVYGSGDIAHVMQPTPRPLPRNRQHHVPALALNVNLSAGDNVQTTGLVNATGTGTVHVGGTASSPKVDGDITAVRGDVAAFDTVFHLLRGDVRFYPSDGFLPTIDAEAVAFRPEADVTVSVYGRVDQLHTDISSDPPMSTQAILADLLHINDINNALSGGGTGGAAAPSLTNVAGNVLTGRLLSALNFGLERTLHIEEVDLAFDQNGHPTLELRKQYGKNLYALYRTSLSAPVQQEVGMAYTLRHNLEIQWIEKQNTAGQSQWQQGQYTTWTALYRIPNGPAHRRRHAPEGERVDLNGR